MSQFDQSNQRVQQQHNAGRDINISNLERPADIVPELERFKHMLAQANKVGQIDEERSTDVEYQVTKAIQQAQKPKPDKDMLLRSLTTALSIVQEVGTMSGFVPVLVGAIEAVRKLFS